jgi:hypothetical protein
MSMIYYDLSCVFWLPGEYGKQLAEDDRELQNEFSTSRFNLRFDSVDKPRLVAKFWALLVRV